MKRIVFILLCLASLAQAEIVAIQYDGDGDYLLTIANGIPTLTKVKTVIDIEEEPAQPTSPPIIEPPPPTPSNLLDSHRQTVTMATQRVQDPNKYNVKKSLASLYKSAAALPLSDKTQLIQATNTMFGALNLALWREWKATVDASINSFAAITEAKKACQITAEVLEKP